jgi:hypothetical protein
MALIKDVSTCRLRAGIADGIDLRYDGMELWNRSPRLPAYPCKCAGIHFPCNPGYHLHSFNTCYRMMKRELHAPWSVEPRSLI